MLLKIENYIVFVNSDDFDSALERHNVIIK